jgi:hypothetical protein
MNAPDHGWHKLIAIADCESIDPEARLASRELR